jgi:hypothetical protein
MEMDAMESLVHYTVIEFGKLGTVPAVGSTHKIAGNALQLVKIPASALGTLLKILR